ncbi:MAG TPA: hypothetical protein DC000_09230 [Clostridiales bacterium]|nr:hypothetical protein [Clostridiales bacterium]
MKKPIKIFYLIILSVTLILNGCNDQVNNDNEDTGNKNVNLTFNQIEGVKNEIALLDASESYNIILNKNIKLGDLFVYMLDKGNVLYGGLKFENKIYSLGVISDALIDKDQLELFDINVGSMYIFGIQGTYGSHTIERNYFTLEDNMPTKILQISGYAVEKDLDNDGFIEFINTYGTIPTTEIYIFQDNKVFVSNLNNALNAESVILNKDTLNFEVNFKEEQSEPMLFKYKNKSLIAAE